MANQIIETNLLPEQFVTSSSRYGESEIIYYGDRNLLAFKTYQKSNTTPGAADRFTVVTPGQEYRPDKLSFEAYGTPDFWWKIMEANNVMDIFDFKAGLNVRLPGNVF